jgi:hypothetical protein
VLHVYKFQEVRNEGTVLDTNIIVAAFATKGLCSDIFEVCYIV